MRGGLVLALMMALVIIGSGCTETAPERNYTAECLAGCGGTSAQVCANGTTYQNACTAGCYNMTVSHEGACGACKDTDGGKNATVKGVVTADGANYTDYCVVFGSVEEYYCAGAIAGKETLACPEDYECHGGSCVPKLPPIPEPDCHDSDGRDVYAKGHVNASGNYFEDICVDDLKVREYYCDQGVRSEESDCISGYGCEDGRCQQRYGNCTDTDGGNDIYNEGKVVLKSGLIIAEYLDKCMDGDYVREYYCSVSGYVYETVRCPKGYRCVQASCRQDACLDSDGGFDIWRQGAVNKGDELLRDTCTDRYSGIEYYCDDNMIMNATFACPMGYVCEGGRCED